ncbi:MAG: 5-oxoprolinase, partial [Rhodospirillaceae bacterium]|nr:5-oxoprolinase [Rhodospirillaceae bacterium]
NGGLTNARLFQGKDSILSGPAGGVVGMARTANEAGFSHVIGFDMGGTSTDVSHFDGEFERVFDTFVAGVRLRAPMMHIHTVAAGGGSVLHFEAGRFRVGPDSAGADPGPACYRRGGPLCVTDCNVMLGKIQPRFFPSVFGLGADQPLDAEIVQARFSDLAREVEARTGESQTIEAMAEGFVHIAVENMANAIKKISVEQGHDITKYTLNCFGGAGGQHACLVADALAMETILIHPMAGVLSAFGMGLADFAAMRTHAIEAGLSDDALTGAKQVLDTLAASAHEELVGQGIMAENVQVVQKVHLRYQGTDSALVLEYAPLKLLVADFELTHMKRFGFKQPERALIIEAVSAEAKGATGEKTNLNLAVPA